jgi:beta-glucosidase
MLNKITEANILFLILSPLLFVNAQNKSASQSKMDQFIDDLISRMTLEEKAGQMNQIPGFYAITAPGKPDSTQVNEIQKGLVGSMLNVIGVEPTRQMQKIAVEQTRLKIPLIFGYDIIHGCRTIFPIPLGESASWDLEAIKKSAQVAADEASAMGVDWTFAPMVDIARDARWGRIAEGAGEDPFYGSLVAKARVEGFQGDDLRRDNAIVACAKHYAAYGAAIGGRDYNGSDMSERTLREVYLPPFHAAVNAGVGTLMNAFCSLNGVPATGNEFLVKQVLKEEWRFDGYIVSDFNSVGELIPHGVAANQYEAAELAANALCDMDMGSLCYHNELVKLVKDGKVSEETITDAAKRILKIKYRLGLFDDPYKYCNAERQKSEMLTPEHINAARDMARKSIVLLKNENDLLPLKKDIGKLAVIGPLADAPKDMLGCWYGLGDPKDVTTILNGIKKSVSPGTKILYSKGCEINSKASENYDDAVKTAKQADVVIMVVGEAGEMSGEAHSRAYLDIPGNQLDLIKAIKSTGKPMVILLANGRPLSIKWIKDNIPSIVETWFLGTEAGNAVADVVFGDYNPSGKLTVSFPYTVGQEPLYYSQLPTGRPLQGDENDVWKTHYMDVPNDALFPFGYGLSYTTFEYSNLRLNKQSISKDDTLKVLIDVKNTGGCSGEEVVQLYIRGLVASVSRPVKELKGFKKMTLKPGEKETVTFPLVNEDLKYYDKNMNWISDPGEFKAFVGGSSVNTIETSFVLK